jgi:hypothetical protein
MGADDAYDHEVADVQPGGDGVLALGLRLVLGPLDGRGGAAVVPRHR